MHNIDIPQDLVNRVIARMGDRHSCKSLDPPATALLVVDMQNYFVMEGQSGVRNRRCVSRSELCNVVPGK